MKFDENLRNLRKEKEFSQEYLAEKMNVSRQTISKWENGTAMPDLKKLTELAELFNTSMDELLGTSAPINASYQVDSEELNAVKAELSAVKEELKENKSKNKRMNIILCLFVVALAVTSIVTNNNLKSTTNDIWNAVNNINSRNNVVYGNDDYEPTITDDVEYSITKVNSESPNIIEITFKYSPTSYVKGSKVSYIISSEDKNSKPITVEAKLDGKAFIAKAEIDIAKYNSVDVSVDDGTNIKTEELYPYLSETYSGFSNTPFMYYIDKSNDTSTVIFYDEYLEWESDTTLPKKTQAFIEARLNNGKTVYSKELQIKTYDGFCSVVPCTFNFAQSFDKVVIRIVDENNTQYIIGCDNDETEEDESIIGEGTIEIEFPNGEKLNQ